jgi:superfamily II DNA or RNA helicase
VAKTYITQYGQVIVDECHHISAFTFEKVLKNVRAKYVYGLSATPIRKDGLHPIIFMQCGSIRFKVDAKTQAKIRPFIQKLISKKTNFTSPHSDIQTLYMELAENNARNQQIFNDVLLELEAGRSPMILTERVEHVKTLENKVKLPSVGVFFHPPLVVS